MALQMFAGGNCNSRLHRLYFSSNMGTGALPYNQETVCFVLTFISASHFVRVQLTQTGV